MGFGSFVSRKLLTSGRGVGFMWCHSSAIVKWRCKLVLYAGVGECLNLSSG